jgi:flagellar biosynthetic protein FliQ
MNELFIIDTLRDAFIVILKMAAIPMGVALVVGVVISLLQALTQIQETTLSFVPKIIGVFFSLILGFPYIMNTFITFTHKIFDFMTKLPN